MFEPTVNDPGSAEWDIGPTLHLSWDELACHDEKSTQYPLRFRGSVLHVGRDGRPRYRSSRALILAYEFEWVRHLCGDRAMEIGSAYRTLAWNRKVGSTDSSQHVQARALDIYPHAGIDSSILLVHTIARARTPGSRIKGIGLYTWGVHLDVRRSTRIARWNGRRVAADVAVA